MRTPDGQECDFYHEDYHRGRDVQECRARKSLDSAHWQPADCAKCSVPKILLANASPNLVLEISIRRGILGIGGKVKIKAHCRKHDIPVENPYTGCPQCNAERPGLSLFAEALEDLDE